MITFRPMSEEDTDRVLEIIEAHDEDDREAAEENFRQLGLSGLYVMLLDQLVIGVSGCREQGNCDKTFQLSWTYVDKTHCGKGYGRQLLEHILKEASVNSVRKLFIYVSDYKDEEGRDVYAAARHLYSSLGFENELVIKDYYDEGESLLVFGKRVGDKEPDQMPVSPEKPKLKFNELYLVDETEATYSFGWETKVFGKSFSKDDVLFGVDNVKEQGGKLVLLNFPSNFENLSLPLSSAGFEYIGHLKDYYEDGVHDDHFQFVIQ